MAESDTYGNSTETLFAIKKKLELQVLAWNEEAAQRDEHKCFEHLMSWVKTERGMQDRLLRRGLEETTENALYRLTDVTSLRIATRSVDDIYRVKAKFAVLPGVEIAEEKGYIQNVKPSDYRSLHLIPHCKTDAPDLHGRVSGQFFIEVQIRTIIMGFWASLEHEICHEREGDNHALTATELKRVVDDLASCDLSIRTICNMVREGEA